MPKAFVTWTAGAVGGHSYEPGEAFEAGLTPELLGGKGYGLARMCADGYPVPPGFTNERQSLNGSLPTVSKTTS